MKRAGNLFDRIVERENLRLAFCRAARGKRGRAEVHRFADHLDENLDQMAELLRRRVFPVGRYHQFVIRDPKERVITAPCFPERVLHHAIINVCESVFERWLIHDTYACRIGRGRIAAVLRAAQFAQCHPFFLKLDIRKYFDSIPHRSLLGRLTRLFKDQCLLELFERIVQGFRGDVGRGLPIGSLTSQHFANFYLGWCDRFVKETLRVEGYVRYMDDIAVWGQSTDALQSALRHTQQYLSHELGLTVKAHPFLNRTTHGMDFLGCRVFADHTRLNARSKSRFRRSMMQLERSYANDEIDERELQSRAMALIAFTRAAETASWHFRTKVLEQLPVSGRRPRTG